MLQFFKWSKELEVAAYIFSFMVHKYAAELAHLFTGFQIRIQRLDRPDLQEIGVSYPCADKEYFVYFAGAKANSATIPDGFTSLELVQGDYIVCTFEAENFQTLVMNVLYKVEQYLYGTWLPNHKLQTEPFCAERYESHTLQTTSMEVWLKLL